MPRTCWSTPTGSPSTSTTRRSASSRSTRTARSTGRVTSRGRPGSTGRTTSRTGCGAASGTEDFGALLGSRGISDGHTIVLYGDRNNWFAAYTYWYLKYYGHNAVRLVDGPRDKWIADGRPTTTDRP